MLHKNWFYISLLSIYLVVYCTLLQFNVAIDYAILMWICSPVFLIVTVIMILKYGRYNGPELGENEFGYQDKNKDELGVF